MIVICDCAETCTDMGCRHRLSHKERKRDEDQYSPCDGHCSRHGEQVLCSTMGDEEDIS